MNTAHLPKSYHEMSRDDLIAELIKLKQKNFLDTAFAEDFSSLFLYAPIITFIISAANYKIAAVNELFLKSFALPRAAVAGQDLRSLKIWPGVSERETFLAALKRPAGFPKEYSFLNDRKETLRLQISVLHYEKEEGDFIIIWGNDMTKLAESQKKLIKTTRSFTAMLENSPAMISRFDRNFTCAYANKSLERLTGSPSSSMIGKSLLTLKLPKAFRRRWTNSLTAVFETKKPAAFTAKYPLPFGKEYFYQTRFIPEFNDYNEIEHVLCTTYDVTPLKRIKHCPGARRARPAWYLSATPDILLKCDLDGNCLDRTGSLKKDFGFTQKELIGKNIRAFLPFPAADKIIRALRLSYESHTIQTLEYALAVRQKQRHFEARVTVIPHAKELLLTLRDITEQKALHHKIERLNQLQLIGEVASAIGHEIRNPLTTVRGFLQLMRRKKEWQAWNEQLNLMLAELERSNSIISKFLSLTHDKTPLAQRPCLEELIAELKS